MVVRSTVPQSIFFTSSQLKKETTSSANFSIKKKRNDEQQNLLRYIPSGTARGMGIFYADHDRDLHADHLIILFAHDLRINLRENFFAQAQNGL